MHCPAELGAVETVEGLLRTGLDVNVKSRGGQIPLHYAIVMEHIKAMQTLVDTGTNIDSKNDEYQSLLQGDVISEQPIVVLKTLLANGASTTTSHSCGVTILHDTAQADRVENLVFLLQHMPSRVYTRTMGGHTAFHVAADNGRVQHVRVLLSHDARIDEQTDKGNTALSVAALRDAKEVVKVLIENHAQIDIKNKKGDTAVNVAMRSGEDNILQMLLSAGAGVDSNDNTALKHAVTP